MCLLCNVASEFVIHTMVKCSFVIACWQKAHVAEVDSEVNTFAEWLSHIFKHCSKDKIQVIVMICSMVLKCRNETVWNQHSMKVNEVVESAKSVLNQWISLQDKSFVNHLGLLTQDDGHEHWRLPIDNRIKVNVDAAIFDTSNSYSFNVVARNHQGELIKAWSRCKEGKITPEVAEGIGIR